MREIILASQSPRRKQLLEWAEINFRIVVSDTDEQYPVELPLPAVSEYIALQKALAVKALSAADVVIIAADTVVVLEDRIIGKPGSIEEAVSILSRLSGNAHQVITGVVILDGERQHSFADTTEVEFNSLTPEQIRFYAEKYQPLDKAGAYAIQEWIGVVGIKRIHGDFYNVMGLPVSRVVQILNTIKMD